LNSRKKMMVGGKRIAMEELSVTKEQANWKVNNDLVSFPGRELFQFYRERGCLFRQETKQALFTGT
jgi:hypothetical protein